MVVHRQDAHVKLIGYLQDECHDEARNTIFFPHEVEEICRKMIAVRICAVTIAHLLAQTTLARD
ncbi:MAG: hypothetical protein CME88_07335 [Hirschia sp.]|nr:hypothetical protein [Hirschia sp.]MBF18174.1 hypothetical protein [Hirschia sp.]